MNVTHISVFVRVVLYIIAGRLSAGGWLPHDAPIMFTDPALVEALSGIVLAVMTAVFTARHEAKK